MPGCRCAVFGCNNSRVMTKSKNENVIYHRFPKGTDLVGKTTKNEWIRRCRRADKWNPNTSCICSAHFCDTDYERDLRNELLGLPVRKILKKTAVPTLNLPKSETKPKDSSRQQRLEERNKRACGSSLTTLSDPEPSAFQSSVDDDIVIDTISEKSPSVSAINYDEQYNKLLADHNKMKTDFLQFRQDYRRKIKCLNNQLRYYKDKYVKSRKTERDDKATRLLKTVFTENQIMLLSNRKKRVNWTSEEIATALTLRCYSKKCYLYLRNELKYPLPGPSTLKKWSIRSTTSNGVLNDVVKFRDGELDEDGPKVVERLAKNINKKEKSHSPAVIKSFHKLRIIRLNIQNVKANENTLERKQSISTMNLDTC